MKGDPVVKLSRNLLAALVVLALAEPAWPQARLVKNIRITPGVSPGNPSEFVTIGSTTYFVQTVPDFGTEIWKTDGTTAGTALIRDICTGSCGSDPASLTAVGNTIFFAATGAGGRELWKTDGTEAGTLRVKDIWPGSGGSSPMALTNAGGVLFFRATSPDLGSELWLSDGSAFGTAVVRDGCAGSCSGLDQTVTMTAVGSRVFFSPAVGQLWVSDGTASGTKHVTNEAVCGTSASNGLLLFASCTSNFTSSKRVYATGGATGTVLLASGPNDAASNFGGLAVRGTTAYFLLDGRGLYRSDGTTAGTVLVKELFGALGQLTGTSGDLFFTVSGAGLSALWKSDGTAAGTTQIAIVPPPVQMVGSGGGVYFVANANDGSGYELWKSDGTEAGTAIVKDVLPGPGSALPPLADSRLIRSDGKGGVYFSGDDGANWRQIWKSDGTPQGTSMVYRAATVSSSPIEGVMAGSTLFFSADDGIHGRELWKSDGTDAGTVLVKDINPGFGPSSPQQLTESGGQVYFSADDGAHGRELWRTDGTDAGTVLLADLRPGGGSTTFRELVNVNGSLFFTEGFSQFPPGYLSKANSSGTGVTLLYPGSFEEFNVLGGTVYFLGLGRFGAELWRSDGTPAGTTGVRTLCHDNGRNPEMARIGDRLLMAGGDPNNCGNSQLPPSLWMSDGTTSGTVPIVTLPPTGGVLKDFVAVNDVAFFLGYWPGTGDALWKSDGTPAGTKLVSAVGANAADLTTTGRFRYFTEDDGVRGREPWRSDGTAAGTFLLKDINAAGPSNPTRMTVAGDALHFIADDGVHGRELWRSDGTPGGTALVQDVAPGSIGDVGMLVSAPQGLFFSQMSSATGDSELWLAPANGTIGVLRLYHPAILEHLYTTDAYEYSVLGTMGWTQEGQAYKVLYSNATYQGVTPIPLHRLYNPGSSQHLWTTDSNEAQVLAQSPHWSYEGPIGYVLKQSVTGSVPLYRMALANPSLHLWTTDANEYQVLQTRGWIPEGIIGYVIP
jgi:ELWxxDGT repeat protein